MSGSHFTCEDGFILTRACRKSSPVAFALHLSIDGSATYSGIGETLSVTPLLGGRMKRWLLAGTLALAAGGQGLASDDDGRNGDGDLCAGTDRGRGQALDEAVDPGGSFGSVHLLVPKP